MKKHIIRFSIGFIFYCSAILGAWLAGATVSPLAFVLAAAFSAIMTYVTKEN